MFVLCNDHESSIHTIQNTGILELYPSYRAKSRTTTLIPSLNIPSKIYIDYLHAIVLNITEIIQQAMKTIGDLNITQILSQSEKFARFLETNTVNEELSKNEIALKTVIAKTKENVRMQYMSNRMSMLESFLKYLSISISSILFATGICWKFSLFSKISSIFKILSCLTNNSNKITNPSY